MGNHGEIKKRKQVLEKMNNGIGIGLKTNGIGRRKRRFCGLGMREK